MMGEATEDKRAAAGRRTRAALASRWLLALAIAGSALAVGTIHTASLCIVTILLATAAVLGWWGAEPIRSRSSATLLLLTGSALTAYTALQCVPMPIGWLTAIAPHNADVWSRVLSPLHEAGPGWAPISLDPIATRVEALKGVAYLLAFVTALRVARTKERVGFLIAVIVATAVALAIAALLHPAFGARRLFGLYEPGSGISDRHIAPLMNPNHLAAYINMGFCMALAWAISPQHQVPRSIAAAIALFLAAVQLWVASRGGVVSMVLGAALVLLLSRAVRLQALVRASGVSLLAVLAALIGVVMITLSSSEVSGELFSADVSKLEIATQGLRMAAAYPIFGAGRGAFASTFPRFRGEFSHMDSPGYVTFTHPENIAAQWTSEWGLPVAIAAALAIIWALRPTAVLARSTLATGASAALIVVAVHNFGDFSSEIPGVMLAAVVGAAIVVGGSAGHAPRRRVSRWSHAPSAVAIAAVAIAVPAVASALLVRGEELGDDQRMLYDAVVTCKLPAAEVFARARVAMKRHPAEPYFPFMAALSAAREGESSTIAWLGAVLERAPIYGPAHLMLARMLGHRSPAQARLEYRITMEQAPELAATVPAEAQARVGGYWDALELVPPGAVGDRALASLVTLLEGRLPASSARLDMDLAARAPGLAGPILRTAQAIVEDLEAGSSSPWCEGAARASCEHRALEASVRAEEVAPHDCLAHELRARARIAAGDSANGLDDFARATDLVEGRVSCQERLVSLAVAAGDARRADSALAAIENAGCADDEECAHNLSWVAGVEEGRGNPVRALALYRRASERNLASDSLLENVARLAVRNGLHMEAAQAYDRLTARHPENQQWRRAADAERQAAMRGAMWR